MILDPADLASVRGGADVVPESAAMCQQLGEVAMSYGDVADKLRAQYTDGNKHMDLESANSSAATFAKLALECNAARTPPTRSNPP
jgi:hypothetical protein